MQRIGNLAQERLHQIVIENELMRAGFSALPYLVMKDQALSIGSRLTYAFLLMYAWQDASCFAGQKRMAADMGLSERQVQRFLYELRDAGYIRIERRDKRFNNTYTILDKKPSKLRRKGRGWRPAGDDTGVVSGMTAASSRQRRRRRIH